MRGAVLLGGLAVVLIAVVGLAYLVPGVFPGHALHELPQAVREHFEDPFNAACEEALRQKLVAPSTYQRVDLRRSETSVRLVDYFLDLPKWPSLEEQADYQRRYDHAVRWVADIDFDASNRLGVPLRDTAHCTYITLDDSPPHPPWFAVKVGLQSLAGAGNG
jgi:hypothetical protein